MPALRALKGRSRVPAPGSAERARPFASLLGSAIDMSDSRPASPTVGANASGPGSSASSVARRERLTATEPTPMTDPQRRPSPRGPGQASGLAEVDEQLQDSGSSLGRQAASGVLWSTAQKWAARLSGLATLAILARVLTPAEFGLVAAASSIVPLVYVLADLALSAYLVQLPEVDQRTLSTCFWLSVAVGSLTIAGITTIAPVIAYLLDLPELVPVLRVLSLSMFFVVLASVPIALLRRSMAFRAIAINAFIGALIAQGVAIAMALNGAGVWALVAQLVVSQGVVAAAAWLLARWRPSFTFSPHEAKAASHFGAKVVGVEVSSMSRLWAETGLVTAVLGVTAMGYLAVAQRLVQVFSDLSAASIVPVSQVLFARIRDAAERLQSAYRTASSLTYAAVAPFMAMLLVGAPVIVPLLYGDGWDQSILLVQALSLAAVLVIGAVLDHGLFYGVGRPGTWLSFALAVDIVTVAVTAIAVRHSLLAVAIGFLAVAVLATGVRIVLVARLLDCTPWFLARPVLPILAAAALASSIGAALITGTTDVPAVARLLLFGTAFAIAYAVAMRVLSPSTLWGVLAALPLPAAARTRALLLTRLETTR